MFASSRFLLIAPFLIGCSTPPDADDASRFDVPSLERAAVVRDGRTGESITFAAMQDDLADADVVFLGETHLDETTHRVERAVYEGLIERTGGRVVLAMEMFERDVQPALDAYLAGASTEAEFLAASRPWANYRTAYRPLIELAKLHRLPVVASNTPVGLRRKIAIGGEEAWNALSDEERSLLPLVLHDNTDGYWRRVANATRGHGAMGASRPTDRRYSTQCLWDNTMGDSCARALDERPGHVVLHVNGGFHSQGWDGTVHQLMLRRPDASVKTVAIHPVVNPAVAEVTGEPIADYVVFAENGARDQSDGLYAVTVSRELRYRLHVPASASFEAPAPLLIWFDDVEFSTSSGMRLLRDRLGAEAAICVVEAPFPQPTEDLEEGGRWFRDDSFSNDLGDLAAGVERICGYVRRNLPVDPDRVVLAGEGQGATAAIFMTVHARPIAGDGVAFSPSSHRSLSGVPLPLPEGDAVPPANASLVIVAGPDHAEFWNGEFDGYRALGVDARLAPAPDDPWRAEAELTAFLRDALSLPPRGPPASGAPAHLLIDGDSPRARRWARVLAHRLADERGGPVAVVGNEDEARRRGSIALETNVAAARFRETNALPRSSGPFGGTTVVVVPRDVAPAERAAWLALEADDPIAKSSRFHRLRVAAVDGGPSLGEVLAKLQAEGRRNVLVVPAVFCASADLMRTLRSEVRHLDDDMTVEWRPGLGLDLVHRQPHG